MKEQEEPSRIKKLILFLKALELGFEINLDERPYKYEAGYVLTKYKNDNRFYTSSEDLIEFLDIAEGMSWQEYVDLSLQVAEKLGENKEVQEPRKKSGKFTADGSYEYEYDYSNEKRLGVNSQ